MAELEMNEHKIAVLYMLKTIKIAISNRYLIEILAEAEIIEYYPGLDILHYFEKFGLVCISEIGGTDHYKITLEGIKTCELFENKLPNEIKNRIEKACKKTLSEDYDLRKVYTQTSAIRDGMYYFKCGVFEQNDPLFEIRLRTENAEQVQRLESYFRLHSAEIYEKLFNALGEESPF